MFGTSYCQLFRFDGLEAASANLVHESQHYPQQQMCLLPDYEARLVHSIDAYLKFLRQRDVPAPILIALSMIGVRGAVMGFFNHGTMLWPVPNSQPIRQDSLLLPEVVIESYDDDWRRALRHTFDVVWNAANQKCSPNYDKDGNWNPRR